MRAFLIGLSLMLTGCGPQAEVVLDDTEPEAAVEEVEEEEVPSFKRTAALVDWEQAVAENPNLEVTVNRINAGDPLSALGQAPFVASQAVTSALQHQVDLMEAEKGRKPTFAELDEAMKNTGMTKGLKPWQVYAYNESTGEIAVLTDPVAEAEAKGRSE